MHSEYLEYPINFSEILAVLKKNVVKTGNVLHCYHKLSTLRHTYF